MEKELSQEQIKEAARQARIEYYRKWRSKPENKEKQKTYNEKYWMKKVTNEN